MAGKLIVWFALLFIIGIAAAEESYVFSKDSLFTLSIPMSNTDYSKCTTCTCDYSIFYPNGSVMVDAQNGTNDDGFCVLSNSTSVLGTYPVNMHFTDGLDYGMTTFEFKITPTGYNPERGIDYVFIIVILIAVTAMMLYITIHLKSLMAQIPCSVFVSYLISFIFYYGGRITEAIDPVNVALAKSIYAFYKIFLNLSHIALIFATIYVFYYIWKYVLVDPTKKRRKREEESEGLYG